MIRLTNEENPYKIPKASIGKPIQMFSGDVMYAFSEGAEAQLKKVVEYIDKELICGGRLGEPEQDGEDAYFLSAKGWQALLEEVK